MEKRQELYRGKAKTVYATDDPSLLVMHYRDDVSAFDGVKLAQLERKGETNNLINAYIMGKLAAAGVATHFVRVLNERESLVRALKMVPIECVVRNICAGSMAKRYGIEEGTRLPEPIFEFFLKSDPLHDPLVNDDHIRVLGWGTAAEIAQMQSADASGQCRAQAALRRRRHGPRRLQARVRTPARRPARAARAGRRIYAGRLPPLGQHDA